VSLSCDSRLTMSLSQEILLPVRDYDLAATLDSGQVFRWQRDGDAWAGVLGKHFLRLTQMENGIRAQAAAPVTDWQFLREFLQNDVDLAAILKTFPDDGPMRAAVANCPGLRLLRQDPWECLASFILSSTKQIVQIRQIVGLLCERFGEPVAGTRRAGFPACRFTGLSSPVFRTGGWKAARTGWLERLSYQCLPSDPRRQRRLAGLVCGKAG